VNLIFGPGYTDVRIFSQSTGEYGTFFQNVMRIAPSPVRLSKDGSETRDAGAHLNCLAPPPNLEFLRVLHTHFHPQLLRQNLGKQQKQRFPKVFQSSSFQISSQQQASLLQKQNSETPANPPQNSVPKRTQNQNRQKQKKVKKIHSTSVYRKLLKPDHKRNQQQSTNDV